MIDFERILVIKEAHCEPFGKYRLRSIGVSRMWGFQFSNPLLAVFLLLSVLFTLPVTASGETTPRTVALEASVNLALEILQDTELAQRGE